MLAQLRVASGACAMQARPGSGVVGGSQDADLTLGPHSWRRGQQAPVLPPVLPPPPLPVLDEAWKTWTLPVGAVVQEDPQEDPWAQFQ